jgi:hypothetical protein
MFTTRYFSLRTFAQVWLPLKSLTKGLPPFTIRRFPHEFRMKKDQWWWVIRFRILNIRGLYIQEKVLSKAQSSQKGNKKSGDNDICR